MPAPAQEQSAFLLHSEKFALREAAAAAPACEDAVSLVSLIERVGLNDGQVAFSASQAAYLRDTLVPWAQENAPFGPGPRGTSGMQCLEAVASRLAE